MLNGRIKLKSSFSNVKSENCEYKIDLGHSKNSDMVVVVVAAAVVAVEGAPVSLWHLLLLDSNS